MHVTPELDAAFRAAALAEELVDVRHDVVDSPVGPLQIAWSTRGLCRISYTEEGFQESPARTSGARVLRTPLDDAPTTSTQPSGSSAGLR